MQENISIHWESCFLGSRKGLVDLKYCAVFFQPPWKVYQERIIRSQGSQDQENANSVHGPNVNTVTNSGPRILCGTRSWLLQLFLQRFCCSKEKNVSHDTDYAGAECWGGRKKLCILPSNANIVTKDTLNEHGNKQHKMDGLVENPLRPNLLFSAYIMKNKMMTHPSVI